ncbi:MAG: aminopeptidase P family protein [Thermoleophilia bacterium]|nr:aminopeptidase P family protein [Thermoleophilia bacterium]
MAAVGEITYTGLPREEVERRYRLVREAAARDGLDAVIACGNEYTGFEGAVTYLSGFNIVHRYAYVLLPVEGEPAIVFPSEARYVGEHGTTWIEEQVFVDRPGEWLADRVRGKRVGVYGLDYIMTVRDYRALEGACELVGWDVGFDHARMVKSELELASVRESVRINTEGFWVFLEAFAPGKTEREILAPCEQWFVSQGCGRWTMDMVLDGPDGSALPEFKIAGTRRIEPTDLVLPSLEVAGPGGHWVEVSRAICPGEPSDDTKRMMEAYEEYYAAAQEALRTGSTAHDAHRAVSKGFHERGYRLGHVTGHSIGMTMIEFPKIGEGDETELEAGMVLSMHPHAISQDGQACLYMQDTWLVTDEGGVPLAGLPMRIFDGSEKR